MWAYSPNGKDKSNSANLQIRNATPPLETVQPLFPSCLKKFYRTAIFNNLFDFLGGVKNCSLFHSRLTKVSLILIKAAK